MTNKSKQTYGLSIAQGVYSPAELAAACGRPEVEVRAAMVELRNSGPMTWDDERLLYINTEGRGPVIPWAMAARWSDPAAWRASVRNRRNYTRRRAWEKAQHEDTPDAVAAHRARILRYLPEATIVVEEDRQPRRRLSYFVWLRLGDQDIAGRSAASVGAGIKNLVINARTTRLAQTLASLGWDVPSDQVAMAPDFAHDVVARPPGDDCWWLLSDPDYADWYGTPLERLRGEAEDYGITRAVFVADPLIVDAVALAQYLATVKREEIPHDHGRR
jgi:hypothetical protein